MPPPRDQQEFLQGLAIAEHSTQILAAALLAGQPDGVAAAAQGMQQSAQALSAALQGLQRRGSQVDPGLQHRLRRLGHDLAMQREACLRRAAVVDRAVVSLIPSARSSTYAGVTGPYGQQARRSGAFKLMSA
jgi:predicted Abi (CAAX) family protease